MKTFVLKYQAFISALFIVIAPVSGKTEKTEGDTVEFTPAEFTVSITTMEWTHVDKSSNKIKAIKWDSRDQSLNIPNPRFKKITSIDTKTGKLTIESLTKEHSGQYKFELNGETKGEFSLEVSEKPQLNGWYIALIVFCFILLICGSICLYKKLRGSKEGGFTEAKRKDTE